jgi:hypothetical protein
MWIWKLESMIFLGIFSTLQHVPKESMLFLGIFSTLQHVPNEGYFRGEADLISNLIGTSREDNPDSKSTIVNICGEHLLPPDGEHRTQKKSKFVLL